MPYLESQLYKALLSTVINFKVNENGESPVADKVLETAGVNEGSRPKNLDFQNNEGGVQGSFSLQSQVKITNP